MNLVPDFSAIRTLLKNASDEKRALDDRIVELQRQRDSVLQAPIAKADLIAMLDRLVTTRGEGYTAKLRATLGASIRGPSKFLGGKLPAGVGLFQILNRNGEALAPGEVEEMLCALFGDQLRKALAAAVERMEWPAAPLPMAERAPRLAELDAELDRLVGQRNEIVRRAQEAGVDLG